MSNYSHRGYEHRTGGYGRRRHKASGFKRKSGGGTAAKVAAVTAVSIGILALVYLFADNVIPFVDSIKGAQGPTPDVPVSAGIKETAEQPPEQAQGSFDSVDGSVFVQNGSGYVPFKGIETTAKNYSAILNSISSSMSESVNIYSAVIPTNAEFGLKGVLSGNGSQRENLDIIDSSLSDRVKVIDVYSALEAQKNDYIFYRTDESMTSKGAYYVYKKRAETAGYGERTVYSLSTLSEKSGTLSPFYGSFVERTTDPKTQPEGNPELAKSADTIEYYKLPVHYNCYSVDPKTGGKVETDLFKESAAAVDLLKIFPAKDTALLEIENVQESGSKKLLIVKDHSAEPVIGYLVPHYSDVYVADVSLYSGNLMEYVNENEITDVLIINGIEDANNSLYCQRLRDLFDHSISD